MGTSVLNSPGGIGIHVNFLLFSRHFGIPTGHSLGRVHLFFLGKTDMNADLPLYYRHLWGYVSNMFYSDSAKLGSEASFSGKLSGRRLEPGSSRTQAKVRVWGRSWVLSTPPWRQACPRLVSTRVAKLLLKALGSKLEAPFFCCPSSVLKLLLSSLASSVEVLLLKLRFGKLCL